MSIFKMKKATESFYFFKKHSSGVKLACSLAVTMLFDFHVDQHQIQ